MSTKTRDLFIALGLSVLFTSLAIGLGIVITMLFGGKNVGPGMCVAMLILYWPFAMTCARVVTRLHHRDHARRFDPVRASLEEAWVMEGRELDYRNELLQKLFASLGVAAKPEAPLPTGTRVDAYMEFDDEDWYVTIKKGLNNQKRLLLQGEVEDIILHAPRRDRDLWICVIIGLSEDVSADEISHFEQLVRYAVHRSAYNSRKHWTGEKSPSVHIEVLPAIVPADKPQA